MVQCEITSNMAEVWVRRIYSAYNNHRDKYEVLDTPLVSLEFETGYVSI